MKADLQAAFEAGLREDFVAFVEKVFTWLRPGETYKPNWHIEALAYRVTPIRRRERVRLIINVPPRSLKSIVISVALPAWLLGHDPSIEIVCISYSDELARKLSRDCRAVMESAWYKRLFPRTMLSPRKNSESEIVTTRHGARLATSTGGTLTGRGGSVLIIDDPLKANDAESESERKRVNGWFDSTLPSRVNDKAAGAIILVMQRLHEDDPTGHLLGKPGWDHLSLAAIAGADETIPIGMGRVHHRREGEPLHAAREGLDVLRAIEAQIGSRLFKAQYQQQPVPAEGNMIRADWLHRYTKAPSRADLRQIVVSCDTATKIGQGNDYTVFTVWGVQDNAYYLLELERGRWEFPELLNQAELIAAVWRPHAVLIEDAGSGSALIQTLERQARIPVIAIKTKLDKQTRVAQQTPQFESGRVLLPVSASWLADLEHELLAFPNGRHDDQVDSMVQFLHWASERDIGPPPFTLPDLTRPPRWRL